MSRAGQLTASALSSITQCECMIADNRYAMYLPCTLEEFASSSAAQFPVLFVTGARQVGRTTFLHHQSEPGHTYISLDDSLLLDLAKRDSALFFQRFRRRCCWNGGSRNGPATD